MMPTLGSKIREIRLQRGMTQADLGANLVTPSMISQIESDRAKPSFALLTVLADRLGVPVDYFLTSTEDEFPLPTQLKVADLLQRAGKPEEALAILERLSPGSPGLVHQEYDLLLARSYRMLGRPTESVPLLEGLREQALRAADHRLLFLVCLESGHVEYAMDNLAGAIHEWKKAFELGEILSGAECPPVDVAAAMLEIAVGLYKAYVKTGKTDDTQAVLAQAKAWTGPFRNLQRLALGLLDDAHRFLRMNEPSRARMLVENAVAVLEAGQWMQNAILFESVAAKEAQSSYDPSQRAVTAFVGVDVHAFIEAELIQAQWFASNGDFSSAFERLARCERMLGDYQAEASHDQRCKISQRRIRRMRAHFYQQQGQHTQAIAEWENLLEQAGDDEAEWKIECIAQLITLYAAAGMTESALSASEQLYALLAQRAEFPLGLVLR